VLPSVALGFAVGVAVLGVNIWRRTPKPRWVFVLALAAGQSGFELFQAVRTVLISFQNLGLMLQLVSSLGTLINPVAFCTSREKRAGLSTCFS